jgi:hypothetical protein
LITIKTSDGEFSPFLCLRSVCLSLCSEFFTETGYLCAIANLSGGTVAVVRTYLRNLKNDQLRSASTSLSLSPIGQQMLPYAKWSTLSLLVNRFVGYLMTFCLLKVKVEFGYLCRDLMCTSSRTIRLPRHMNTSYKRRGNFHFWNWELR